MKEAEVADQFRELEAILQQQHQQIDKLRGLRSQEQDPTFDGGPSQLRSSVASGLKNKTLDASIFVQEVPN